jgi:ABC-type transport system involved in multi-copper enzyme maturation permease subunit
MTAAWRLNAAVLRKTSRDALWLAVGAGGALVVFEILYVRIITQLAPELIEMWRRFEFIRKLLQALVSIDVSQNVSMNSLITLGFVHPFLLIVMCALVVTTTTKATVAEVDRGTADLLLSLPIGRRRLYATVSLVWMLAGAIVATCAWLGLQTGAALFRPSEPLNGRLLLIPLTNLLALYLAVGCATMLISSGLRRRGVAVAIILGLLLFSFLINFLDPLFPPVRPIAFLGFLHYYRPVEAVRDGLWPVRDLAVLLGMSILTWVAGMERFARRDVPA